MIWGVSNIGKNTIGKELSKKLNCKFYDGDEEIIDMPAAIYDRLILDGDDALEYKEKI